MKRFTKLTALVLSIALILSACGLFEKEDANKLPITFEYNTKDDVLRNGRLVFTINGIRIIDNIADLPEEGGIRDDGFIYTVYHTDGKCEALEYPELVQPDGSFAAGTYMVLVEMTATSEDAERWTTEDLNDLGNPLGGYSNPYWFAAEWTCALYTKSREAASRGIAYFSLLEPHFGNWYLFELLPGETKEIIVGFFVDEDCDTEKPYELDELCLRLQPSLGVYEYVPIFDCVTED